MACVLVRKNVSSYLGQNCCNRCQRGLTRGLAAPRPSDTLLFLCPAPPFSVGFQSRPVTGASLREADLRVPEQLHPPRLGAGSIPRLHTHAPPSSQQPRSSGRRTQLPCLEFRQIQGVSGLQRVRWGQAAAKTFLYNEFPLGALPSLIGCPRILIQGCARREPHFRQPFPFPNVSLCGTR